MHWIHPKRLRCSIKNWLLPTRRRFIRSTVTRSAAAVAGIGFGFPNGLTAAISQREEEPDLNERIFKTLKINMVGIKAPLSDRFAAARDAGFAGIEMNSPGMEIAETRKAIAKSTLPVDGTVISTHWKIRHSSPDATVRATALEHLQNAIRDTHAVGGNTTLLVVGHGKDGTEEEVWQRSFDNIVQAIPIAARYGIHIVIENVWNKFLYDHDGAENQTADKFIRYVDQFESPWVGMQLDIGNHWRYANMGDWIRSLGKRVIKLDLKGYHRGQQEWTHIGKGDIDWADVRKALVEINYFGWAAAEIDGGGPERLSEISANIDRIFNLSR